MLMNRSESSETEFEWYIPELLVSAVSPVIASDRRERSNLLTLQTRLLRRYAPRNDSTTDTFVLYPRQTHLYVELDELLRR